MMIENVIWHLENQFIVGLMLLITHIVIFGSMVTLVYYMLSALDSYIGHYTKGCINECLLWILSLVLAYALTGPIIKQ